MLLLHVKSTLRCSLHAFFEYALYGSSFPSIQGYSTSSSIDLYGFHYFRHGNSPIVAFE